MKYFLSLATSAVLLTAGCRPQPIAIDVAQDGERIAIVSTALDEHTVIIAVSYSITSLLKLEEDTKGPDSGKLSRGMLLDSALVTISDGTRVDTLTRYSPGIYRSTTMDLTNGASYTLKVEDRRTGMTAVASTQYQQELMLDSLKPFVDRRQRDTLIQLRVGLRDDHPGADYYVVAYDRINPLTIPSAIGSANFAILQADEMKRVEVFSDAEAVDGRIEKTFNLQLPSTDTLFVQYGRITKGYYDFLASYKRSGGILTQAIAEPVTLPTNVINGLGYFSLYDARRETFVLRQY